MRTRLDALALSLLLALVGWLHRASLSLPLRNADDWFHVDVAAGLLDGDPAAFARIIGGYGASDSLRVTPWLLWVGDLALFGFDGAGYHATNLLLHLGIVAATFALIRSLGGGVGGALAGGAVLGLNIGTGQGTYYLAARDDQLMTLLVLLLVAGWPRLRSSRRGRIGALVLYGAACLCKPPAIAAVALLWLVDRGTSTRRSWLPFVAVGAVYALAFFALLGPGGRLLTEGAPWYASPLQALRTLVVPGSSLGLPDRSLSADGALWALPAVGLVVVALLRATPRGALRLGLGWLLVTLPVPLLYLAGRSDAFNDTGRQMLLPSVGLALVVSACAPKQGRWEGRGALMGGLVAASFAAAFLRVGPHFLERSEPTVGAFVQAVQEHQGPLVIALQRPDRGLASLLTSGALPRMAGGKPAILALQGGDRGFGARREPYGYGRLVATTWPEGPVLAESYGPPGSPPSRWPSWVAWTPTPRTLGEEAQRWSFAEGPGGWSAWPPASSGHLGLPRYEQGLGFLVDARIRMPEGEVRSQLGQAGKPGILRSPPLEIDTAAVCGLDLDLDVTGVRPEDPRGTALVPEGRFAVVTWSEREDLLDGWRGVVVAPVSSDGRASLRLDRSLPWTEVPTVRRLGLLASNLPGRVVIRGVSMRWCR